MQEPPLVTKAREHTDRLAVFAGEGKFTYADLLHQSAATAHAFLDGGNDLAGARVAFLIKPGFDYVRVQWGIWRAGGIAVPLAVTHPQAELDYVLDDADVALAVSSPAFGDHLAHVAQSRGVEHRSTSELATSDDGGLPHVAEDRAAMILYTSGTTGRPKGVVSTHANLAAQIRSLVEAWHWKNTDWILLNLPLHHLHGILNVLSCGLWSGATVEMLPEFEAREVWDRIRSGRLTVFMAVPTIYRRLISLYDDASQQEQRDFEAACRDLRLMVSGSAALPVSTLERWQEISGHTLLERYGMTEIGMALSNPYDGERRPGHVGRPLPGVEVRLVDDDDAIVDEGDPGEIQVRGPNVFREYWRRPEETAESFSDDGWFRTGDMAVLDEGDYRIMGRTSVDILKTGGEKVSALEIEEILRAHPAVEECAVVGVPDPEWGQRVVAVVVASSGNVDVDPDELRVWCRSRLAPYKVPKEYHLVSELPRNALGKVTKPQLLEDLTI